MISRLLILPAEIRSLIFEFAVTAERTVVTFCLEEFQQDSYCQAIQPPLTRVSKQVRSESLPLYYECNDFVLHTESPKAVDAQKWLRCNGPYLSLLRRISLWVRYVPLANERASSQGAISVSLYRPRKCDPWKTDDSWQWITVMRRPAEIKRDAKFILEKLNATSVEISKESAGPEHYFGMMMDLRSFYTQEKMS